MNLGSALLTFVDSVLPPLGEESPTDQKVRSRYISRVLFDICSAVGALSLAFAVRFFLETLYPTEELVGGALARRYLQLYYLSLVPFVLTVCLVFHLGGLYRSLSLIGRTPTSAEIGLVRWVRIVAVISAVPLVWSLGTYFLFPHPVFPRSVILFSWQFLLLFCAVPRIIKSYLGERVILQVSHHRRHKVKNVLVIGGAGYIGSHLCRQLMAKGYTVRVLDSLLFGAEGLEELKGNEKFELLRGDFRNVEMVAAGMRGMDAVVHLGGIVGDPACSIDDDFTIDVNLTATTMLAEVAKVYRIERFIFASTCSVYGEGLEQNLTEESPINPVSLYARTKFASEQILMASAGPRFSPTILRFGTLFGISPRPRFDLFVNLLTAKAVREGRMTVFGGNQWRPFIHARDAARALVAVLEAPLGTVGNQIFNVGSSEMNFRLLEVAERIRNLVPTANLVVQSDIDDRRDYQVSFRKLETTLGVSLASSIDEAIIEMREFLMSHESVDPNDAKYWNVAQTKILLSEVANSEGELGFIGSVAGGVQLRPTAQSILKRVVGA